MKIKSVALSRFRGYSGRVEIPMDSLRVLVGKNDIGKSSFLEALDIFFNEGKGCVKLDKDDINKQSLLDNEDSIEIEVIFTDLPSSLVIDSTNITRLQDEYLVNQDGDLHVIKRYPNAGAPKIFIRAFHPTAPGCRDLLLKKNNELKTTLDDQGFTCADRTRNAELRKAIWSGHADLCLDEYEIEVAKIDSKNIWEQLKLHMPLFTLFQSDRKNEDSDDEVQDPMRIAVKEILKEPSIQASLDLVAATVKGRLEEVANRTLEKLRELSPNVANTLAPKLPAADSLKWPDVFKSVSIAGDDDIPINKRGSGVKRLVLISFFRAEAERRLSLENLPNVVYAIEEPETSQHPDHQRSLADALIALASAPSTQVIFTTHSPEIVKRLTFDDILLVTPNPAERITGIKQHELPYPSLNEVNYVAFGESTPEYHNELYGHIEEQQLMSSYLSGKPIRSYCRLRSGSLITENKTLSEYIRHQIHHPENKNNAQFTPSELSQSIEDMRLFLST
jgi:predicted ATP-dependent endonuclease of OLD family